jgi:hypothetical protein
LDNWGEVFLEAPVAPAAGPAWVRAVGRLVAIRTGRIATVADVEGVQANILRAMGPASATDRVICTDCRATAPLSPGVVDAWSRCMRELNQRVERSAMLVDAGSAMFNLQAERAVRCAGKAERRIFTDPELVLRWLDASLGDAERSELRRFLAPDS